MKTTEKTTGMKERKVMLSLLWIFVMFNFTYGDILTLYFNPVLQKQAWKLFQSGFVGSVHITQGFVFLGAILLETAIVMILLSRVLPYRVNRWYAWTWRQPEEGGALTSGQSSVYEQEERDGRDSHAYADK